MDSIAFAIMPCAIAPERLERPELLAVSRHPRTGSAYIANGVFMGLCHRAVLVFVLKRVTGGTAQRSAFCKFSSPAASAQAWSGAPCQRWMWQVFDN